MQIDGSAREACSCMAKIRMDRARARFTMSCRETIALDPRIPLLHSWLSVCPSGKFVPCNFDISNSPRQICRGWNKTARYFIHAVFWFRNFFQIYMLASINLNMFRLVYLFSFVYLELLDNLLATQIYQLRAFWIGFRRENSSKIRIIR